MSDKDIKSQLEGLFSDIVPEPEATGAEPSLGAEAGVGQAEVDMARAETAQSEPEATQPPAPSPAKSQREKWSSKLFSPPAPEPRWNIFTSIRARLTILLVLAATLPLLAVGVWSLYTLQTATQMASGQSEAALAGLGEAAIAQTARATARQVELYLDTHPEVDLNDLAQLESNAELAELAVQPVGQTGYTAVFDENAITHFHANPKTVGMDMRTLADTLPQFWAIFEASLDGSPSAGYYDWEDADGQIRAKYMSIVPVGNTRLRVAATTYMDEFSQPVATIRSQLADTQRTALIQLLAALVGVFLISSAGTLLIGQWVSRPIGKMAAMVKQVETGDWHPTGLEDRRDEIGILARAFNTMIGQLQQTLAGLEQRVAERTHVLELAVEVGGRLSSVRDLDRLLAEAVELIRASFDLYHVQVYLADPAGRYLTLRAGTGEVGAELVRRSHSLQIGHGSINGTAAAEKRAMIVSDTTQSRTFLPNPLLPDTCSEMAVPLLIGERALGVLDLQSTQPGGLSAENLPVFEALAGQLAIAIENAGLFRETAQARAEVEAQLQQVARQGWEELLDGVKQAEHIGYTYEGGRLEAVAESVAEAPAAQVLATPIQLHGQSIGAIQVEAASGLAWSEAEAELVESVARQVAQQAENLRLLTQAESYRAQAEQATRRLTREGWQAYLETQTDVLPGFVYDLYQVKPLADGGNGDGHAAPGLGGALKVRGETIGELAVDRAEGLDDQAAELVAAVAERLSAHIENLRLLEETQQHRFELEERGQELEASQRVTFAANETDDPDELLDLVVNLIRDQFDLYHAQVYLVDREKQAAVLRKSTGYAGRQLLEQGHAISLDQAGPLARAIRGGQPVAIADVSQEKGWQPDPLLSHTRSELAIPLKAGQEVIGALDVHSRTPNRFTARTVALFSAMAEQVAMNFESADLLIRTTQQAEALTRFTTQLRTAAEVSERLSAILDPQQLLSEVVDLLQSRFGLYHVHVYLLETPPSIPAGEGEAGGAQLAVRAGSGEVGRVLCERGHYIPLDAEKSVVARAARERETVLVADTSLVSDFMPNPLLPETRSEMAVPLLVADQVLGVLDVQDNQPGRFTPSDMNVFATLAGQIATALENAHLFEEQKRAEETIREISRQNELVLTSAGEGIYGTDKEGTITFANPAAAEILGWSVQELLGQQNHALFHYNHPDGSPYPIEDCPVWQMYQSEQTHSGEEFFWKKDGTGFPVEFTATPVVEEGKVIGAVVTFRDITVRKQAEEAIRDSRARFQGLVENLSDWIWEVDPNGAYTYVSPKVTDLLGYQPEEVLGKTPFDFMPPEEVQRIAPIFGEIVARQKPIQALENTNIHKDGHLVVFETSGTPIYDAQGRFQGYRGTDRDITERKWAEESIRIFQALAENALDAIAMVDLEGNLAYANRAYYDLAGYTYGQDSLIGIPVADFAPEEQRAVQMEAIGQALASGGWSGEAEQVRRDGSRVAVSLSVFPIRDESGRPISVTTIMRDVTERKRAEEAVRESQQMLQTVMDNVPQSIFWKDQDLVYLGCNREFAEDAGKEAEEIIGKTDYDMPWVEQAELYRADDSRVMEAGEPVLNYEEPQTTPDGSQIWLRTSKVPLRDAAGNVTAVLGIYEDITDRKQAEQAMHESEERFRGLYEASPLGIILNDFEKGTYLAANDAFLDMVGYTIEELNQLSYFDLTPKKYAADEDRQMDSMLKTGRFGPYEKEYIRKDGTAFPVVLNGVVVTDSKGHRMIWSTVEDITERKRAAQERERFTTQLSTAADVAAQIGAILDPDQLLNTVIPLLKERFGLYYVHFYTLDEAARQLALRAGYGEPGRIMLERGHNISLDAERSLVARAARSKEIVLVNDVTQEPDFLPNPLLPETRSEVAVPAIAGGVVLGVFDVQHNVPDYFTKADLDVFATLTGQITTALQNAGLFEEIQRAAERLREVDRLKSEFLANMSHELRTPLNSILGYTEVMLMGISGELDPEMLADVQAIYDNGKHLLHLINDVLDLAKIEAGRLTLNIEEVEIAPLLEEAKTNNAGLLVNKPVDMIMEVAEGLPAIRADRTRLSQILNNLVSNAAKFTDEGHIIMRAFGEDQWLCLEVEDTGVGIKESDLETIFEQFHQGDASYKKRAEGTGLGLAITRHLVNMHGGSISVRSQVGQGSTFSVRLPVESRAGEAVAAAGNGQGAVA